MASAVSYKVKEENYFFKLSKYKDAIIKHIKTNPDFIIPSFRANEVINQLEDIQDISVSRVKMWIVSNAVCACDPVPSENILHHQKRNSHIHTYIQQPYFLTCKI